MYLVDYTGAKLDELPGVTSLPAEDAAAHGPTGSLLVHGDLGFVSNPESGEVHVIDLHKMEAAATVALEGHPTTLALGHFGTMSHADEGHQHH